MALTSQQQQALDLGWRLAALAEGQAGSVPSYQGTEDEAIWQHVSHFMLIKSAYSYRALLTLLREGLEHEALVLLRSLVEALINLRYMAQDPLQRARLFLEYDFVARHKRLEALGKHAAAESGEVFRGILESRRVKADELTSQYQRVKPHYKNEYLWSGKTIKQMAESVGMGWEYDFVYADCCARSHGAAKSVNDYFRATEDGLLADLRPSFEDLQYRAYQGANYLARVISVNEEKLGRKAPLELPEVVGKMQALVEAPKGGQGSASPP
jgi:hypothetical protein